MVTQAAAKRRVVRSAPGWPRGLALASWLVGLLPAVASGLEFRLKDSALCRGPQVCLGEIAVILDTSEPRRRELARLQLFPAPPPGGTEVLPQRFLRQLLELQQLPEPYQVTGPAEVAIHHHPAMTPGQPAERAGSRDRAPQLVRPTPQLVAETSVVGVNAKRTSASRDSGTIQPASQSIPEPVQPRAPSTGALRFPSGLRPVAPAVARSVAALQAQAPQRVERAILDYLGTKDREQAWSVEVTLSPQDARLIPAHTAAIRVSGGLPPWTGRQTFQLDWTGPSGETPSLVVEANVELPPLVVVAKRRLRAGVALAADDFELARPSAQQPDRDYLQSLDELRGQTTRRSLVAGQPLERQDLQAVRQVRRQEAVLVVARAAGVVIKTTGVAQEDGGLDDVIVVASATDPQQKFPARVVGHKQVEVLVVQPERTTRPAASGPHPIRHQSGVRQASRQLNSPAADIIIPGP